MAKIITVASQKGGVGKTTSALNLGYSLSRFGHRVIIIDTDPQGGLALSTNLRRVTTKGLLQYFSNEAAAAEITMITKDRSLAIVGLGIETPQEVITLEKLLQSDSFPSKVKELGRNYDYMFIDAQAGLNSFLHNLLRHSDSVLIPVVCRILTLKSLPGLLKTIHHIQQHNSSLQLEGVVVTMFNQKDQRQQVLLEELHTTLPEKVMFKTIIPFDDCYEQASVKAIPIGLLRGGHKAARYYLDLALEFTDRQDMGGYDEREEGLF